MKRFCSIFFFILTINSDLTAQPLSLNGFYIAKTGSVPAAGVDIYTYLRFYNDGTVYLQAVSSLDPQTIAGWFGRYKKFSQKGTYQLKDKNISIQLNNRESEDFKLEGLQETNYKGSLGADNKLCMTQGTEAKINCFGFYQVLDSTKLKYATYKPELILPGEWKVKQILKGSGQVFFINSDSTIVALTVFKAARLPVYKEAQSEFETAYAYYEWDSKYMHDEEKMEVKKVKENKEQSYVIWNAKDANNDNYHLFARKKDLLFNIMVYDPNMPVEKQLKIIELLYNLNK